MKRETMTMDDLWAITEAAGILDEHALGISDYTSAWTIEGIRDGIRSAIGRGVVPANTLARFDEFARALYYA